MSVSFLNVQTKLPLGLKNNNPGNLRLSNIKWQGKIPNEKNTGKGFEQFENITFGIRAMLTDVANDITVKKFNTLTKLINSYAPPSENDTINYINFVSKYTGINPNTEIKLNPEILSKIIKAKIFIENGATVVNKYLPNLDTLINEALQQLNPATKKRINFVKVASGASLIIAILAGIFFLTKKY
jgi:hypothetical protein